MQTFNKQNPSLLKDLFQEAIKQQKNMANVDHYHGNKWDTCKFHRVSPSNVLHHSCKTFSKKKNDQLLFF